jgi:molybdopterin converting factor small subunit
VDQIRIQYFAVLKQSAGKDSESVPLLVGDTPKKIYQRLASTYGFTLGVSDIRVAVNDEFAAFDYPLKPSDKIVFIPPVAGG